MNENKEEKDSHANTNRSTRSYGWMYPGVWLIVIGLIFLLNNFGYFQGNAWGKLWPLFMIVPGVLMLLRPRR